MTRILKVPQAGFGGARAPVLSALLLLCGLCAALTAAAAPLPLPWRADWPNCKPVEKLLHRGSDVALQPTFYINGSLADTNGWNLTTYVQTNAVGAWFGPLPGAFFSHTNDVGAAFYSVMVRAETPGGSVNYTAFARFRMLDSPGFLPGELPLPAKVIDFADVTVLNPPWAAAIDSATNTLDQSVSSRLSQTSRDSTNYTDSAIAAASTLTPRFAPDAWAVNPTNVVLVYRDSEYEPGWTPTIYISEIGIWDVIGNAKGDRTSTYLHWSVEDATQEITAYRSPYGYILGSQTNAVIAAPGITNGLASAGAFADYYTRAETDDAIDALAAYYITANAEGDAFPSVAALTNATAYYSGGALRTPTRNDYAVVLADETHGGAEWRYIYAVHEGATTGQWEAQYPIETNDYDALSNKPSIGGVELSGNKSAAQLGLATPAITNNLATVDALNIVDGTAHDAKMAASEADDKAQSALDGLSSRPTYAEAATTATNAAGYAISTADTSYPRFTTATNLNQSVQYLTAAPNNILTIELPPGSAATKDWIVYAYFGVETPLVLPPAIWWMTDEAYTNAIPASTPTALYFSQVADGIFTLSRQELKSVEIAAP